MRPLMELSATLDTYRPNSAALFRSISANSKSELILNEGNKIIPLFGYKYFSLKVCNS